ncbi:threonine-phosphate decarboxylase CobD [Pseudomonas oligotrophica]|uniref:threonine-phosphate decarboxylase CobD n=1 Tax=Pseudomonas oligotrophica TaxID=2912055 RepID=UPI001F01C387|nr:threonine-phosphate decarboxylase CobD [Pseudomonas oligotrophica]MCF7202166.1 threonine-phosphate decarboxylase CobD [Pseudomonas oligotrophica]
MLEHGGRLRLAAQRHGIPLSDLLDLSTGVAPYHPPLPSIADSAWARLPEPDDGLQAAARRYYGAQALLPVAGSQAAIQALPRLRRAARVGVVSPCYAEHAAAWRRAGHRLLELSEAGVPRALEQLDVLLVVNPNNPTGQLIAPQRLLDWHDELAARGGWLVVDEAFMDCTPEHSLAAYSHLPGLLVLRSFGKFFGLAGARLGFVLAESALLQALAELLGPWTVNGPTRQLGSVLLADSAGQQLQHQRLVADGQRLAELLRRHDLAPLGGCALFQWWVAAEAAQLHEFLARRGILTRLFAQPSSLRFGLPTDAGWQRLDHALQAYREQHP